MKTFAATLALMSLTSAVGISQDENADLDFADIGNVLRVAQHICLDGNGDAYSGEQMALDIVAEQVEMTGDQVCDGLLEQLTEGDDGTELAQADA